MSLTVDMSRFRQKFGSKMGTFYKATLINLFGSIVKDTPVDTGRLRSSWQFAKGAPEGGAAAGGMEAAVASQVTEQDATYYFFNALPYARRIEYEGWSHTKAPDGMVRKNLVRVGAMLKEEADKLDL